jgi:hypothetical protein
VLLPVLLLRCLLLPIVLLLLLCLNVHMHVCTQHTYDVEYKVQSKLLWTVFLSMHQTCTLTTHLNIPIVCRLQLEKHGFYNEGHTNAVHMYICKCLTDKEK